MLVENPLQFIIHTDL